MPNSFMLKFKQGEVLCSYDIVGNIVSEFMAKRMARIYVIMHSGTQLVVSNTNAMTCIMQNCREYH